MIRECPLCHQPLSPRDNLLRMSGLLEKSGLMTINVDGRNVPVHRECPTFVRLKINHCLVPPEVRYQGEEST